MGDLLMVTLRDPDSELGPFRERDTVIVTATVTDNLGVAIPGASLTSIVYTLYAEKTLDVINSRDHVNAASMVNVAGVLTLELVPADMAMVGTAVEEKHRLLIEWIYASARRGSYEIRIVVQNEQKVP